MDTADITVPATTDKAYTSGNFQKQNSKNI